MTWLEEKEKHKKQKNKATNQNKKEKKKEKNKRCVAHGIMSVVVRPFYIDSLALPL